MRSLRPTAHGRLTRWFYALLNARYGVLLGVPIAAVLLTVLIARSHSHDYGNGTALYYVLRSESVSAAQMSDPRLFHILFLTPSFSDPASLSVDYGPGQLTIGNTWHSGADPGGGGGGGGMEGMMDAAVAYDADPVNTANGNMVFYFAPIITTTLDNVVTEYQGQMMYSSASTLLAQVVRDTPSANYFSTLAYFGGDTERQRLMQPIMAGIQPVQASTGITLSGLAAFFRQDKPINVVAELDATTFQKEPAEPQRILFNPHVPISFTWNIKPLEEREQDLTVKLFLEGIPVNGTEFQRIPISSTTLHTYVSVPVVSYGSPIAVYTTVCAALTFILGRLATWGVPRIYVWVSALYGRQRPRSTPVRRGTTRIAVAARRHTRKTPGRRNALE